MLKLGLPISKEIVDLISYYTFLRLNIAFDGGLSPSDGGGLSALIPPTEKSRIVLKNN